MVFLAKSLNWLFTFLMAPLSLMSAGWGLFTASAVTGVVMLIIFRYTSNQSKIKTIKDLIKSYILEIRLYKDSPRIIMRAFGRILLRNAVYIRYAFVPLLIVFVPVVLILVNLDARYAHRGIDPGETTVVRAILAAENDSLKNVILSVPSGIQIETPALHVLPEKTVIWRLKVIEPGQYRLKFSVNGQTATKTLYAIEKPALLSPERPQSTFFSVLFHPAETALPPDSPFSGLFVAYPARTIKILGIRLHWLVAFFILSLVFAFALKKPFKVEI